SSESSGRYYQLTHDFLVDPLREWLTRMQQETRRGRAELRLAERAAWWQARSESRYLPGCWEWAQLRLWTRKSNWTGPQRQMMGQAARHYALRGFVVTVLIALIAWAGCEAFGWLQAHALRDRLLDAGVTEVPRIIDDMAPYRRWLDPLLQEAYDEADANR